MFSLRTYTLSPPSSNPHPPLSPPPDLTIYPSIYPSSPFGCALSGTLELFIKASKPTASNTRPLERKEKNGWGALGEWGGKKEKDRKGEVQRAGMRGKKHKTESRAKEASKEAEINGLFPWLQDLGDAPLQQLSVFSLHLWIATLTLFSYVCVCVCARLCVISVCTAHVCVCGRQVLNPKPSLPRRLGLLKHLSSACVRFWQNTPMFANVRRIVWTPMSSGNSGINK